MTPAQRKALLGLYLLEQEGLYPGCRWNVCQLWWERYHIARAARGDGGSYPVKTLVALWQLGLVEPQHALAVELVASGQCRCGCDRWRLTATGRDLAGKTPVRVAGRG